MLNNVFFSDLLSQVGWTVEWSARYYGSSLRYDSSSAVRSGLCSPHRWTRGTKIPLQYIPFSDSSSIHIISFFLSYVHHTGIRTKYLQCNDSSLWNDTYGICRGVARISHFTSLSSASFIGTLHCCATNQRRQGWPPSVSVCHPAAYSFNSIHGAHSELSKFGGGQGDVIKLPVNEGFCWRRVSNGIFITRIPLSSKSATVSRNVREHWL